MERKHRAHKLALNPQFAVPNRLFFRFNTIKRLWLVEKESKIKWFYYLSSPLLCDRDRNKDLYYPKKYRTTRFEDTTD